MHFNKTFAARILAGLMIASTMAVPAMAVSGTVNSGNTTLNLREGANTESKVLADLQNGSKVEVLATAENGWYQIAVDGLTGFAFGEYLILDGAENAVTAAASLYRNYDRDLPYCFNRKEAKDHGEGGSMVGYKPQDGDDVAIVEDVVTAGTAVRESIELFKHVADVNIKALFVSVDRMERGTRECSTLDELRQDYGIQVFPIVTVREVIAFLHNNSIDGKVYIDDEMKAKMEAYLEEYGAKG